MPPKTATKKSGGLSFHKRLTTDPEIWESDPEFYNSVTSQFEKAKNSYGFDKSATTTKNRRKMHLAEYEGCCKITAHKDNLLNPDGSVPEDYLWGEQYLEDNIRGYIIASAKHVEPRSYSSQSIKFNTLLQRRQSLIYWVSRKAGPTHVQKMWTASQEALHYAFRELNISTPAEQKLYLTKHDLVKLIEFDSYTATNREVSQQHQLCWLLGFVCGVRPGSIGTARERKDQFLQWKDVSIKRSGSTGSKNFTVTIRFRWLKGYRDETTKTLRFTCAGPRTPEDAMYSIPHRILAILLDRRLLQDYSTLEELLNGDQTTIRIKEHAMDWPVICASGPKGNSIDYEKAATCDAISAVVQRRAMAFGLPAGITHYAWRRSAGAHMAERMGTQQARQLLGHEADSNTFETNYDEGILAVDTFGIAMGSKEMATRADLLEAEDVTANRIKNSINEKDIWILNFINKDPDYKRLSTALVEAEQASSAEPENEQLQEALEAAYTARQKKRRVLNRQGQLAFQKLELDLVQANMTNEELEKRLEEARKPGIIASTLLKAAQAAKEMAEQIEQTGELPEASAAEENEEEDEEEAGEITLDVRRVAFQCAVLQTYTHDDLRDAREMAEDQEGDEGNVNVDSLAMADDAQSKSPEIAAIAAACQALMEILAGPQLSKNEKREVLCPACQTETYVDDAKKNKRYMPGKLNQHLGTGFHAPKKAFLRRFKGKKNDCPYGGNDCGVKGTGKDILQHVHTNKTQSDRHLIDAANDGLLARDFDTRLINSGSRKTRVVDGQAQLVQEGDPQEVDIELLVRPRNLLPSGEIESSSTSSRTAPGSAQPSAAKATTRAGRAAQAVANAESRASKAEAEQAMRLPTVAPLTQTVLWQAHETDLYGDSVDVLQEQRQLIADELDNIAREAGVGQTATGETRKTQKVSSRRQEGILHLRQRLFAMGWRWSEDDDNILKPDEEDDGLIWGGFDEGDVEPDSDDPDADVEE